MTNVREYPLNFCSDRSHRQAEAATGRTTDARMYADDAIGLAGFDFEWKVAPTQACGDDYVPTDCEHKSAYLTGIHSRQCSWVKWTTVQYTT